MMARNRRSVLRALLCGWFAALLATLIAMLALAVALVYLRFGDALLVRLNQIVKLGSVVLGVCVAVPRGGEKGFATGVVLALGYALLGYGLYLALGGGSFVLANMLGEMLLGCAAGAITGAVRANLPPHKRRTRASA